MMFKKWLESVVLSHISGASGSGKTTLANQLSTKYPNIIFKDLDEFDDDATRLLGYNIKKSEYTDEMLKTLFDKRQELINEFIKQSKKPIIFVGHHTEGDYVLNIPTSNRFILDTDAKTSAWRAYLRSQKEDPKFRRKIEELLDDEQEAQEIINFLKKNGYKSMSQQDVFNWVNQFS